MFLLGLLAIIQAAFLPGLLVVTGFGLCRDRLETFIYSFSLSAVFNYFLVLGCIMFGIYTRPVVLAVMAVEVGVLAYLLYRRRARRPGAAGDASPAPFSGDEGGRPGAPSWSSSPVFYVSLALVGIAVYGTVSRLGDVFSLGDVVNSFNRWALDFAQNRFPHKTYGYPQLLSANYSLSYVLTGDSSIWIFAKAWVSCFFPVLMLTMLHLYRRVGRWEVVLAQGLTLVLFYLVMTPRFVYGGISDIALATFAFQAIHIPVVVPEAADRRTGQRALVLGALLAVGCALTKQGGLYILLIYPLLFWLLTRRAWPEGHRVAWKRIVVVGLLMVLAVVPGYVAGFDTPTALPDASTDPSASELVEMLTEDLHEGRGPGERLVHAFGLLGERLGASVLALGLVLSVLVSLLSRRYRVVTLAVTIPYYLVWALGFSYDHRNLSLDFPFLAMSAAFGLSLIATGLTPRLEVRRAPAFRRLAGAGVTLVLLAGLVGLNTYFSKDHLRAAQNRGLVASVGVPDLNRALLEHFRTHREPGRVITPYKTMRWIPNLEDRYQGFGFHRFIALDAVLEELRKPEVQYLLSDDLKLSPGLPGYLRAAVETGELREVFRIKDRFTLYAKVKPPQPETLSLARRYDASIE